MEIVMTRTAEERSTTFVRRDDGVTLELPSYAPLHRLPHDVAHFVVERTLGLPWGFWGSIAAGAILGDVEVLPRKRTPRVEERSRQVMKGASSRVTEAEAVVGSVVEIYQRRLDRDWAAARALLSGIWRPAHPSRELPTQAGRTVMAALCLRVVHGQPSFRQHANKHVPNVFFPCLLDVSVTTLRAQVTVSEGPAVALNICRLDGDDRSLDTDILVRLRLRLYTYAEPASLLEELSFPRNPRGYDS